MNEAIVFCPQCDREWTLYFEDASELPSDGMLECSSCIAGIERTPESDKTGPNGQLDLFEDADGT